jgi:hypothetical protein
MNGIFSNTEVFAAVIGAILAFPLGLLASYLTQVLSERRQKMQITFSRKTEVPLVLAKDELKDKLKIVYQNTEVKTLYYFRLSIANTGRKLIRKQVFVCSFPDKTKIVDPNSFPKVTTKPSHEVGPVERDSSVSQENIFRYTIQKIGVGQIIDVEFLTMDNPTSEFEVVFGPNDEQEVSFIQGEITNLPTTEGYIQNIALSLILLIILNQFISLAPTIIQAIVPTANQTIVLALSQIFALILSIPLLWLIFRSLRPVILAISRRLQSTNEGQGAITSYVYVNDDAQIAGPVVGANVGRVSSDYHTPLPTLPPDTNS